MFHVGGHFGVMLLFVVFSLFSLSDQDMGGEMTNYIMQAFLYMMKILSSRFLEVSILSLENFCQLVNMLFFIYMQYPLYCVDLNS